MTVPHWLLERYALDEVDEAERAQVEADPDHQAQLAELRASSDQVRRDHDKHAVARRAQARATRPPRPGWQLLAVPVVAVAALVLAIQLVPDGHRAKGAMPPELHVYRQAPDGAAEPLRSGELARAGDVLQLEVVRGDEPWGWVVSVDGRGQVTLHNQGVLSPGTEALPQAYRIDDAPAFEHFFVVSDDEPVDRQEIEAAARVAPDGTHALLDLPHAQEVDVLVRKP